MYRNIIEWPHKTLRTPATKIDLFDDGARELAVDLIDTCNIKFGVGLAAPQINISKSMIVIKPMEFDEDNPDPSDYNNEYMVLVNPEIINTSESQQSWPEACLSIPGYTKNVKRFETIEVKYFDLDGNEKNLLANWPFAGALQHEIDHVYGKVYPNRLSKFQARWMREKIMKQRKKIKRLNKNKSKHN